MSTPERYLNTMQGLQTPGARGRLDDCIRTMDIHAKASASADRIEASIEARVKAHTKWCDGLIERLIADLQASHAELAEKERELERERAEKKAQAQAHAAAQAAHAQQRSTVAATRLGDLRELSRASNAELEGERELRERTAARLEAEAELRRRAEARAEDLERSLESAHAVARELEAQLATERGRRRNETHRAEEAEGLVQLSHLRGWMDEAAPLSPLMPRPMPSAAAASPDTEAHRRNFLPRWAPRVGNQEQFHRELAADEALHRQRVAELAEQRRVLQAAEFDGGCWPRQRLFV